MVSQVFQIQMFRPAEAAAASGRIAEHASFARHLGEARTRTDGGQQLDVEKRVDVRGAAREATPWLRSDTKRALAGEIERASAAAGVEPALAVAVAIAESSLNPSAQASDGLSSGTFQVRPSTASDMRRLLHSGDVPRPPGAEDVTLGVTYLRHLDDLFTKETTLRPGLRTVGVADANERRHFAVAAFNAGQGRVAQAQAKAALQGGDPTSFEDVRPHLPSSTRGYVDRVSRYAGAPRTPLASA